MRCNPCDHPHQRARISLWHSHSCNEMLQPWSITWIARSHPAHRGEPASAAPLALSTSECLYRHSTHSFSLLDKAWNSEPNSGCVGSGICNKRDSAMKKGRFIPSQIWFLSSRQTGPDARGSGIPLCCSHTHEVRDMWAQPCQCLSQQQEHQHSRCPLLPAAHALEVGKLFLAEIQWASVPAQVFIAEEVRELLGVTQDSGKQQTFATWDLAAPQRT